MKCENIRQANLQQKRKNAYFALKTITIIFLTNKWYKVWYYESQHINNTLSTT